MEQIFIIETKKRLNTIELLGCLKDTLGRNIARVGKLSTKERDTILKALDVLIESEQDTICHRELIKKLKEVDENKSYKN